MTKLLLSLFAGMVFFVSGVNGDVIKDMQECANEGGRLIVSAPVLSSDLHHVIFVHNPKNGEIKAYYLVDSFDTTVSAINMVVQKAWNAKQIMYVTGKIVSFPFAERIFNAYGVDSADLAQFCISEVHFVTGLTGDEHVKNFLRVWDEYYSTIRYSTLTCGK